MPAIAAQQAALRRSRTSSSCRPRSYQPQARAASKRITSASAPSCGSRVPSGSVASFAAEQRQVLLGQVDPAVAEVLADVAQDVGQLQRDAEGVGESLRRASRARRERPVRTRRATAGRSNRRRSGSTRPARRASRSCGRRTSISQPSTSSPNASQRDRQPAGRVGEGDQHRIVRVPSAARSPPPRASREQRQLLLGRQRAVADVVDAPGHRVHRRQRGALGRGQQPDAPGEVARLLAGDPLALAIGRGHASSASGRHHGARAVSRTAWHAVRALRRADVRGPARRSRPRASASRWPGRRRRSRRPRPAPSRAAGAPAARPASSSSRARSTCGATTARSAGARCRCRAGRRSCTPAARRSAPGR